MIYQDNCLVIQNINYRSKFKSHKVYSLTLQSRNHRNLNKRNYFKLNENEDVAFKFVGCNYEALLKERFIASNSYIRGRV